MQESIFSSDSFIRMVQLCLGWGIAALVVVLISYFAGVLSHPLVRAKKRVIKLKTLCVGLRGRIQNNEQVENNKELIKTLRKIMKKKKSVSISFNVYIYDDINSNWNVKYSTTLLNAIENKCKHALSAIIEGDIKTVAEDMDTAASIADNLHKKIDEVIKKESNDKLLRL